MPNAHSQLKKPIVGVFASEKTFNIDFIIFIPKDSWVRIPFKPEFFQAFFSQLLRSNCEDLSSRFDLSSAVQIYMFYIFTFKDFSVWCTRTQPCLNFMPRPEAVSESFFFRGSLL